MDGFGRRATDRVSAEGSVSLGRARERENAPLAERCFPTFGLFIAPS
jgi:hypothetical protein